MLLSVSSPMLKYLQLEVGTAMIWMKIRMKTKFDLVKSNADLITHP